MNFTMRRESRKDVGRRAWLDIGDGGPLQVCTLIDISPSGAKLAIDDAAQVPQTFRLHLTRDGHPDFSCWIVWRSSDAVGISFAPAAHDMDEG
ncbi:MAG TPA: PilZ domain-containing protein [Xanthobacteraceae bacterium]|nr:PilZ domain-containing protein [Xanthobacteraceae bacterium]